MTGNCHVQFLGEGAVATSFPYPTNELGSRVHRYTGYTQPGNGDTKLVAEESSQTFVSVTTCSREVRTMGRFWAEQAVLLAPLYARKLVPETFC